MRRGPAARLLLLLAGCAGPALGQTTAGVLDAGVVVEGDAGAVQAMFDVEVITAELEAFPVIVELTTIDGTATATDGDYVPQPVIQLIFQSDGVQTVGVDVLGDGVVEADETFMVMIVNVSPGVSIPPGQESGEATILNDDEAALSIADAMVVEGGGGGLVDAIFTVSLSTESALPVTVDYATSDGTATAGVDYLAAAGGLDFAPGEIAQDVVVQVVGDAAVELDETLFVNLAAPMGATIDDGTGVGTILDDDQPSLSIDDAAVDERSSGERNAVLAVRLSAASPVPVTVRYVTRDRTATVADADYRARTGKLTFPPGVTLRNVAVPVVGDTVVEPDETLAVELFNPIDATLADAEGTVTIRNDDRAPGSIRLVGPPDIAEGAVIAFIVVERTGGAEGAASVEFRTVDGSARAGLDYRAAAGRLDWAAGEAGSKSFELPILDDNLREGDETVEVRLANPSGAALGEPRRLDLRILDDDQPTRLEAVGETRRRARVGGRLELTARAIREDGSPVEGVEVLWEVSGDATLAGEASTVSAADGGASRLVELGGSPGTVSVTARIAATEQVVTFEIVVADGLGELFDPQRSPGESSLAGALGAACRSDGGALAELCDYLFGLEPADQRRLIGELTPREAGALADLLLQSPRAQLQNVRRHLAARRRGGSGGRLALGLTGETVPLEALLMGFGGGAPATRRLTERIDAAMFQQLEEPPAGPAPPEIDAPSRWSFFTSGRVDIGERPGSEREAGFDLETLGLTIGLDYRLTARLVVGGALGYVDTQTEVAGDGGGIDARGYSLSGFATYFRDRLWLDAIVGYHRTDYDFRRRIDLPRPFAGQRRLAARGRPEGSQLAVDLGAGFDAAFGATSVSGFGRLSWIEAQVDAFTERGAGPFGLALRGQRIESLLFEAGVEVVRAASRSWGVLQPVVRASVLHELEDDARLITASFAADPGGNVFRLPTDPPDRDFFRLGLGLTATLARARGLYLLYETDLERRDLDLYRLTAGVRQEF